MFRNQASKSKRRRDTTSLTVRRLITVNATRLINANINVYESPHRGLALLPSLSLVLFLFYLFIDAYLPIDHSTIPLCFFSLLRNVISQCKLHFPSLCLAICARKTKKKKKKRKKKRKVVINVKKKRQNVEKSCCSFFVITF